MNIVEIKPIGEWMVEILWGSIGDRDGAAHHVKSPWSPHNVSSITL